MFPSRLNQQPRHRPRAVLLTDLRLCLRQGSNGAPKVGSIGAPLLGSAYTVTLSNAAPDRPAVLLVGGSSSNWGPLPLPFPLALLGGGPGCLLQSSGVLLLFSVTVA